MAKETGGYYKNSKNLSVEYYCCQFYNLSDMDTANEIKAKNVRVREAAYRHYALSSFEACLLRRCGKIKEDNGDLSSNLCCNGFQCCDAFGTPTELKKEIHQFRETLWTPPASECMKWGPAKRKLQLMKFLESCKCSKYNLATCIFTISSRLIQLRGDKANTILN
jgi:hypothetical protein